MRIQKITLVQLVFLFSSVYAFTQPGTYDLHKLSKEDGIRVIGRTATPIEDGQYKGLRLSEGEGEGLVWLKNVQFPGGSLSFDVRGKDVLQKSFVGIAFFGQNDSTFDAIYFRPFNFHAKDSVRSIHAVQYVSHPVFTWKKLRQEKNAMFEKRIVNPPDPNDWFHAKVLVSNDSVEVFINERTIPELRVPLLNKARSGKVGLFVGDGSGGDFANVKIE